MAPIDTFQMVTFFSDFDLGSSGDIRHCSSVATYSPRTLDGWLIAGKHRTLLPFPSYVVSFQYIFFFISLALECLDVAVRCRG